MGDYGSSILPHLDDEAVGVLARASNDTKFCAKALFSETFESPWSILHDKIFSAIDSGHQKVAIAAPRGIGKTSIARLLAMKGILFRDINFVTYIQNSATLAIMQTENIKRELLANKLVKAFFGSVKISQVASDLDEEFSKMAWVAYGSTFILPRGSGQQVRGLNWSGYRPQLIIVDDLEDAEEVLNPEVREKQKDWFLKDVMKSVNFYKKDWRIIYIDTLKHEDSVLQMLLDSPDWFSVNLSLFEQNKEGKLVSLDQNYMTDAQLNTELESHRQQGKLHVFFMEYGNSIRSSDNKFKEQFFQRYVESDLYLRRDLETVVIADPAKTNTPHSADYAIIGVSLDPKLGRVYVRECINAKMDPEEFYQELFACATRLHARSIGVKITSLNDFITHPLESYMVAKRLFFEMVYLKETGGKSAQSKLARIAALVPYYRMGVIYHNPTNCSVLEQQLLSYPRSKLLDLMDALADIIQMLSLGNYYLVPGESQLKESPSEDEYDELELDGYDAPVEGWRAC